MDKRIPGLVQRSLCNDGQEKINNENLLCASVPRPGWSRRCRSSLHPRQISPVGRDEWRALRRLRILRRKEKRNPIQNHPNKWISRIYPNASHHHQVLTRNMGPRLPWPACGFIIPNLYLVTSFLSYMVKSTTKISGPCVHRKDPGATQQREM